MNVRSKGKLRQGTWYTKNHSCVSYIKCLLRLKDKNEKLKDRWLSEDESFTYINYLVLARFIWQFPLKFKD